MSFATSKGLQKNAEKQMLTTETYTKIYTKVFKTRSAVAEMGNRGHNRHAPKRGGLLCPFRGSWDPSSTMWPGLDG